MLFLSKSASRQQPMSLCSGISTEFIALLKLSHCLQDERIIEDEENLLFHPDKPYYMLRNIDQRTLLGFPPMIDTQPIF